MSDDIGRLLLCPDWADRLSWVKSAEGRCQSCNRRVAIAASSAAVIALGARVLCNECGNALVERLEATGDEVQYRRAWWPEDVE